MSLDVEKELKIDVDIVDFLTANIPFLELETTDNETDLEDKCVYWFSSKHKLAVGSDIEKLLYSKMQDISIKLDIKITDDNFIQKGN